jgi:hypothetical protein
MRGGAVRVSRPDNASDAMEMFILPEHTKSIMYKFGKGKVHTLKMSQEEMDRNSMEGGSLYGMFKNILSQLNSNRERRAAESIFSLACKYIINNIEVFDGLYYDGCGYSNNGEGNFITKRIQSFNR